MSSNVAGQGAGTAFAQLNNYLLIRNSSSYEDGGAVYSTLINYTLVGNSACFGGGAQCGTPSNCIAYFKHWWPAKLPLQECEWQHGELFLHDSGPWRDREYHWGSSLGELDEWSKNAPYRSITIDLHDDTFVHPTELVLRGTW